MKNYFKRGTKQNSKSPNENGSFQKFLSSRNASSEVFLPWWLVVKQHVKSQLAFSLMLLLSGYEIIDDRLLAAFKETLTGVLTARVS